MTTSLNIEIKISQSIAELDISQWQNLQDPRFPFAHYHFLKALENSDCLRTRTGWAPLYVTAHYNEELCAALILYGKTNSYGEYIFDFSWAQAHADFGIPYYPKLTSAIPFTPATGSKILISPLLPDSDRKAIFSLLIAKAKELTRSSNFSSLHFLFIPEAELSDYTNQGLFLRYSFQYHWKNKGYRNFDDFLFSLRSKRRREVVRERAQVAAQGVSVRHLTGQQLTPEYAKIMYQFYQSTLEKRAGVEYLTYEFFEEVFKTMRNHILLVVAFAADQPVAGALNFIGSDTLFGRYWGCNDEYRALHFELCYYQGIDYCIQNGLHLFEAGAQGEHKFQRGFLPAWTYSAHLIQHEVLSGAIQNFALREKAQLNAVFAEYNEHSPFSRAKDCDTTLG